MHVLSHWHLSAHPRFTVLYQVRVKDACSAYCQWHLRAHPRFSPAVLGCISRQACCLCLPPVAPPGHHCPSKPRPPPIQLPFPSLPCLRLKETVAQLLASRDDATAAARPARSSQPSNSPPAALALQLMDNLVMGEEVRLGLRAESQPCGTPGRASKLASRLFDCWSCEGDPMLSFMPGCLICGRMISSGG